LSAAWFFIAREAVMLDYSIVQTGLDMNRVVDTLAKRGAGKLGGNAKNCSPLLGGPSARNDVYGTGRAQCVLDAISPPDEIARRKQLHQHNKSARLRALHW
jgi:hypothetical protein